MKVRARDRASGRGSVPESAPVVTGSGANTTPTGDGLGNAPLGTAPLGA